MSIIEDLRIKAGMELCCPVCGYEWGHITVVEQIHCEYGPGARIIIKGECGHTWRFRMVPWKGRLVLKNEYCQEHELHMPDGVEWRSLRR
jgi:hypothetical protein